MTKTIEEINEKIQEGKAVVVTAEEIIDIVKQKGVKKAAQEVDVVTTGPLDQCAHLVPILTLGILSLE